LNSAMFTVVLMARKMASFMGKGKALFVTFREAQCRPRADNIARCNL